MPNTATSQPVVAADTTGVDSLAVDSGALQLEPHYLSGFADSVHCDTIVESMTTLPVMTVPTGEASQPLSSGPLRDNVCMALLLTGVMLVVFSYRSGYKYLENFLHNMFSTRRRDNLFEDHTMSEKRILSALMANTCIVEGLLLYAGIDLWVPSLSTALHSHVWHYVLLFVGIALLFYLSQLFVYALVGHVFTDGINAKLWTAGFNATQSLLGLLLLPVVGVLLVAPVAAKQMLICAIILYFCARIVFICKGFRIFYSNLPSLVYFILYLCAVEIVPIAVLCTGTIFFCKWLQ